MNETYPLSLALFDFVPVLAFLVGAFYLVRTSLICRGKTCGQILAVGSLLVFLGGFFKATWKTLYTLQIADIQWMSEGQFILSGFGFLGIFVGVLYMVRGSNITPSNDSNNNVVTSIAPWKIPFLFVMTLTSLGAEGILAYVSFKRGVRKAAFGFVIGVMGLLAMGALASAEQTLTMQWIEESVNTIGQLGFMVGNIFLYQDFKTRGCETP